MTEPNKRDLEVANKIASDGMMRVGSSPHTIAAYREELERSFLEDTLPGKLRERDVIIQELRAKVDELSKKANLYDKCVNDPGWGR